MRRAAWQFAGMAGRLAGKRAVVTAAGQGIGRATALAFAAEGASVLATDIAEDKLASLADQLIATRRLDVTEDDALAALAAELGPVDVLFNCAGFVHHGTILDALPIEWDASFAINVRSMFVMIRAFLPKMLERGGGASIINMASTVSSIKGDAKPLRLRCDQGGGDRSDQIGGGRFRDKRASAATRSARGRSRRRRSPTGSPPKACASSAAARRRGAPLSSASPWAGSAPRRRWRRWRSISPPTNPRSPPAPIHVIDGGFTL